MVAQDRRSGSRSWVPGLLATFWVLLAGLSGAYLYFVFTNPDAARLNRALASQGAPPSLAGTQPAGVSAAEAQALTDAIAAKDREIASLKSEIAALSNQVSSFDGRLKPIEKVLGPVAALPSSTAVTTSPPPGVPEEVASPSQPAAAPKPEVKQAPPPVAPKPSMPQEAATKPAEAAEPVAAAPAEQAAAKPAEPVKPAPAPQAESAAAEPPAPTQKPRAATPAPAVPAAAEDTEAPEQADASDQDQDQPAGETAAPAEPAVAAPAESAAPAAADGSGEVAALTAPNIPPGTTRFGIELGSVDKQDGIRPLWRNLLTNHAALVAGLQARRIIAPDKKWRLIAGPFSSAAEALQACTLFKKASMPCEATVFAGDSL